MNQLTCKLIMAATFLGGMQGEVNSQERGRREGNDRSGSSRPELPQRGTQGGNRKRFGGRSSSGGFTRLTPIVTALDVDGNGTISAAEIENAVTALKKLDRNKDGKLTAEELRPNFAGTRSSRGRGGISDRSRASSPPSSRTSRPTSTGEDDNPLKKLWSYGLTSRRTGKPLIVNNGEHRMGKNKVSYGHNVVTDRNGRVQRPGGRPLQGGEQLKLTTEYQAEKNVREYARVYSIMAPIRDALLYRFEDLTREEWLKLTRVLAINYIKTTDAPVIGPRSILSIGQVYDYIASGPTAGSPVMRFLEEAELELKCLAFVDLKFPAEAARAMAEHAKEHHIDAGSGIKLP